MDISIQTAGNLALLALAISAIRFVYEKFVERKRTDYDIYHVIIEELVSGKVIESSSGTAEEKSPQMDCQIANIFELRHYPRYFPVTKRILIGLKEYWANKVSKRMIDEIDHTVAFIEKYDGKIYGLKWTTETPFENLEWKKWPK